MADKVSKLVCSCGNVWQLVTENIYAMAATQHGRSRYWCITLNNYTDGDQDVLRAMPGVDYIVCGLEVGTECATPHLQVYMEFTKRLRFRLVRTKLSVLSSPPHIERRQGTASQAADYCKKEGNFWEVGALSNPKQGKRTDLEIVRDLITEKEITNTFELIKTVRSCQAFSLGVKYLSMIEPPPRESPPHIFWIYGSTGTGKSRSVHEFARTMSEKHGLHMWKSLGSSFKFFDGYCGQEIALFDDFRPHASTFAYLLRLTDRYNCKVEVKGGSTWWQPRFIFFTGPKSISDAFSSCDNAYADGYNAFQGGQHGVREDVRQFTRRVQGEPTGWGMEINMDDDEESTILKRTLLQYIS